MAAVALAALALVAPACSKDSGSQAAFCREVQRVPSMSSVVSGYTGADRKELTNRLTSARAAYASLEEASPGDIRSKVSSVVGVVDLVIDAVSAHPDDPAAVAAEVGREFRANSRAATDARAVAAYAKAKCDVSLNPTVVTTTSSVPASTSAPGDGTSTSTG